MPRLFELKSEEMEGEIQALIDLDKVCLVRVEKQPGHRYERIVIRFVDGHENHDIVPVEAAQHFVEAYRAYLQEPSARGG
jgi:hypothetical protein